MRRTRTDMHAVDMNRPEILARSVATDCGRIGVADRQSRHARCHRCRVGAALSAGISQRPPGDREPGPGLEVRPQRHHPDHGGRARKGLDYEKIWNREQNESPLKTITRAQAAKLRAALGTVPRRSRHRGRLGDALRQSVAGLPARSAGQARLRAHRAGAALSAIRRGDHRDGLRCGVRHAGEAALPAGACAWCRRITTIRSISMRWRFRSKRS